MAEEERNELEDLLQELEIDSEINEEDITESEPLPDNGQVVCVEDVVEVQPSPVVDITTPAPNMDLPAKESVEVESPIQTIVSTPLDIQDTANEVLDVRAIVQRHEADYNIISRQLKHDRGKVDSVISMLVKKVESGSASNAEVESLVRALQVLTDSNGHAVKLLDSKAKLMTSAKSTITALIQQNITTGDGGSDELKKILAQSMIEDEV